MKIQGTSLVCYNEITKKATVKIDLTKAVCIEDNCDPHTPATNGGSPSKHSRKPSYDDEPGAIYNVERSFTITFQDGERISFFADTDAEKATWYKTIEEAVSSKVPAAPMWAQIALAVIKSKRSSSSSTPATPAKPTSTEASTRRAPLEKNSVTGSSRRVAPPTLAEEATATNTPDREMRTYPRGAAGPTPVQTNSVKGSSSNLPRLQSILTNPHVQTPSTSSVGRVPGRAVVTSIPQRSRHGHQASMN